MRVFVINFKYLANLTWDSFISESLLLDGVTDFDNILPGLI